MNHFRGIRRLTGIFSLSFLLIFTLFLNNHLVGKAYQRYLTLKDQERIQSSIFMLNSIIWTGNINSDWHNPDNWNPNGIPTINDDVLIPDAIIDPSIFNGDVSVNNLTIEFGAELDLTTRLLTVEGTLNNQGILKQTKSVDQGVTSNFLRITNLAGTEVKYLGVDITPTLPIQNSGINTASLAPMPDHESTPLENMHIVDEHNPPLFHRNNAIVIPNAITAWVTAAAMPTARSRIASATDGCKLFAFGGRNSSNIIINTSEVYDPQSNSWSSIASMPNNNTNASAAWINGVIYIPGGYPASDTYSNQLLAYSISSNSWTSKANMPAALSGGAVAATNGKLYHLGGGNASGYTASVYEYDPATNTWSTRASAPEPFSYASATTLNGMVYIAGGWIDSSTASNRFWRFDPVGNSWTALASMYQGRQSPGLVAAGGFIYAFGGGVGWNSLDSTEKYDPATNTWTTLDENSLSVGRIGMATGWVRGKIWGASGETDSGKVNINEYLDEGYANNCGATNTPPTFQQLPDQVIAMNGSKDNAIDLWAYAHDNETPDNGLTFTIDNSPDPNAGVIIDSNRYVDIFPYSGWSGQTDVTIKVSDPGGLFSTDTFKVSVVVSTTTVNVAIMGNQFCPGLAKGVKRCFDLDPAASLNATVRFYFTETERNAQTLGDLNVFHYDNGWNQEPGSTSHGGSDDGQYVEKQNINDFSYFALFTPEGPGTIYLALVQQGPAAPPPIPTLNAIPSPNNTGFYTVSWNAVTKATGYILDEDTSNTFPHPTQVYNGPNTTWDAQGKSTAKYCYRVRSSNAAGNSAWSNVQCVQVNTPSGPRPGYWAGQGVSFMVTIDRKYVQNFSITIYIPECNTTATITQGSPDPVISKNKFSFSGSFYASGTFTSETAANGSGGFSNHYIYGCGYLNGTFTWSATWQHYSLLTSTPREVINLIVK